MCVPPMNLVCFHRASKSLNSEESRPQPQRTFGRWVTAGNRVGRGLRALPDFSSETAYFLFVPELTASSRFSSWWGDCFCQYLDLEQKKLLSLIRVAVKESTGRCVSGEVFGDISSQVCRRELIRLCTHPVPLVPGGGEGLHIAPVRQAAC